MSDLSSNNWKAVAFLLAGVLLGLFIGKVTYSGDGLARNTAKVDTTQKQETPPPVEPQAPVAQDQPREIEIAAVGKGDHVRGSNNPKVTFIEFSDTECPFCKQFHQSMIQLVKEYPDDAQWVYRHFPLDSLHSKARKEAHATECAAEQDKFWEYLDRLLEVTPSNNGLDLEELPRIAEKVGVDVDTFNECMKKDTYVSKVQEQVDQAIQAGGDGTPYTVVVTKEGSKIPITGFVPFTRLEQIVKDNI